MRQGRFNATSPYSDVPFVNKKSIPKLTDFHREISSFLHEIPDGLIWLSQKDPTGDKTLVSQDSGGRITDLQDEVIGLNGTAVLVVGFRRAMERDLSI